ARPRRAAEGGGGSRPSDDAGASLCRQSRPRRRAANASGEGGKVGRNRPGGEGVTAYLWVALGSALGGAGRFWCNSAVLAAFGKNALPWGTLLANVSGSLLIGAVAALPEESVNPGARLFLTAGVCGGFTTFSGFSLQTLEMLKSGDMIGAAA